MVTELKKPERPLKAACCRGWNVAVLILFVPVLLVIGLLLRAERSSAGGSARVFADPADCVTALMLAQQAGDRDAQRNCLAGPLLNSRQWDSSTRTVDAGGLAGFAITDVDYPASHEATLVLERVYRAGSQRDRVRLRETDDGWKIVELTALGRFAQAIPYGTPVTETGAAR